MRQERASLELVVSLVATLGDGPWPLEAVRAAGWSTGRVRAAVAAGRLVRPRRGVLALPGSHRHRSGAASVGRIRAAVLAAGPAAVVSHESGGVVHGQWLPLPVSTDVHLTESGGIDRLDNGVRVHQSRLPLELVTVVDGLRVTSVARTGVDLARARSLPEAMVAIDGAARALALASSPGADESLRGP